MQSENTQLISEQLARFVVWTKFEDIPEELIIKAQRHILTPWVQVLPALSVPRQNF